MRLLFATRPAYGHAYPLMPLAHAARDAGHDVAFATADPFVEAFAALGFGVHRSGISLEEALLRLGGGDLQRAAEPDPDFGGRLFLETLAPASLDDLMALFETERPDVVVYEQGDLGAPVAAHAAGIPAVCHLISPQLPPALRAVVDGDGRIARLWVSAGVDGEPFDVLRGRLTIDIVPERLQLPALPGDPPRIALRPQAWAPPGAARPARGARPLVYLTLGTVVATGDNLRPAIEGIARLDADVIVALGAAAGAALGELPGNVRVFDFVDQGHVVELADIVVHHGGSGTLFAALARATPQLLLPKGADQFSNAAAAAAAGVATVLEPDAATPEAMAAGVAALLAGPPAAALRDVAGEIAAMPAPAEALAELEAAVPLAVG